jgi:hypothetical protein
MRDITNESLINNINQNIFFWIASKNAEVRSVGVNKNP